MRKKDVIRRSVKAAAIATGAVAVAVFALRPLGYRWNGSPSLPRGLYATAARSDLIEFCPPQPWGYIALKRQYREPGVCPDYGSPLLKPIAASEGDRVELSAAGIGVNGRAIANTAPRVLDSMNRPLDHYPFGTYVVQHGDVWVASSWNYKSFDSRYFGPVRLSAIRHYLRPVYVWGSPNE
jgi:conjugative transfer signal peptidase TraF